MSAVEEASAEIRAGAEAEGEESERSEFQSRAWYESDIREEVERTKTEEGSNAKAETEAAERSWAWAKSDVKDKAEISRVTSKAR